MNVDYAALARDVDTGVLRELLKEELILGFRQIRDAGERLPTASHYASQIADAFRHGKARENGAQVILTQLARSTACGGE